MIVTALRASGDGGCSTPVQIRAWLTCREEESLVPAWTSAFLCAMVGAGVNLLLGAGGSRGKSLCPPGSGWGPHATRVESSWLPRLPLLQVLTVRGDS